MLVDVAPADRAATPEAPCTHGPTEHSGALPATFEGARTSQCDSQTDINALLLPPGGAGPNYLRSTEFIGVPWTATPSQQTSMPACSSQSPNAKQLKKTDLSQKQSTAPAERTNNRGAAATVPGRKHHTPARQVNEDGCGQFAGKLVLPLPIELTPMQYNEMDLERKVESGAAADRHGQTSGGPVPVPVPQAGALLEYTTTFLLDGHGIPPSKEKPGSASGAEQFVQGFGKIALPEFCK